MSTTTVRTVEQDVDAPTIGPTGADDAVVVTLAGTEITVVGEARLRELANLMEEHGGSSCPWDWPDITDGHSGIDAVYRAISDINLLRVYTRQNEPATLEVSLGWLRAQARRMFDDYREQLGSSVQGQYNPGLNAPAFHASALGYIASIAILDRVGWGDTEPEALDEIRRIAAVLA